GGKVVKIHDWSKRRLAYEIKGFREGHYYVLYFEVRPSAINEMWADYHLNEDLIRFMTLRADEVVEKIEFKPLVETAL
ncbi:MAG: 30S ribosomal protein S6, partial [Chlamydiia bacterium]|nr:30S ribosomal protein S6 [Chlamydiia bacterium]